MQLDGTRVYRAKAVAEMLDVSVSTVYRAVRAGELDAYKLGTGKGAVLRIPAHAIRVYLDGCGDAAYQAYVEGDADPAVEGGEELSPDPQAFPGEHWLSTVYRGDPTVEDGEELSPAQADGLACVVCGVDYLRVGVSRVPVGRSETGSQVFACTGCTGDRSGAELVGGVSR